MLNRLVIVCVLLLPLAVAPAFADDSLFEGLGKAAGLIAPPSDPPDFVKASRPSGESAPINVFAPPEEPRSKVKSAAELKTMDADLERAGGAQAAPTQGKATKVKSSPGKSKIAPRS